MRFVAPGLALAAALAYAVSVTLQQPVARAAAIRAEATAGAGQRPWLAVLRLLSRLVRSPAWVIGWILNVVGFGLHAVALHFGSIMIVQAVLVVQLIFALGLTSVRRHQRPSRRDWAGAVAVCIGVAALILLRGDATQSVPSRSRLVACAAIGVVVIAGLLALARLAPSRSQSRSALVAIGAGASFCVSAVFIVVFTDALARLGIAGALHWSLPCLVISSIGGSLLVQESFASGSLPTSLTATTITDPVLSCVAGLVLFDSVDPLGPGPLTGVIIAVALVAVGVAALARLP